MTDEAGRLSSPKLAGLPRTRRPTQPLREGHKVTILAWGASVEAAVRASELLSREGIAASVINARVRAPLDARKLCEVARETEALLILEDGPEQRGNGHQLSRAVAECGLTIPTQVLPLKTRASGSQRRPTAQVHADAIVRSIRRLTRPEDNGAYPTGDSAPETGASASTTARFFDEGSECIDFPECMGIPEESLKRELQQILSTSVGADVQRWASLYSRVGHRSGYLWQWATRGAELTTLPCVDPRWREHVRDTKVLSIIICVLLDDVADAERKQTFLETLLNVVQCHWLPDLTHLPKEDQRYASVTLRLSNLYERRIRQYPYFDVYRELHQYDLMQFLNTMRYSSLLNRHLHLLNLAEHEIYFPHNMHMMSFATLDLMCSPGFEVNELGRLREAVWHGQCMGRIGNLLSTWQRELAQGDFTSDIFARAVAVGDLTVEQLRAGDREEIGELIRRSGHEEFFFRRWQFHKDRFRSMAALVTSVDLFKCLRGHEQFFRMHLASRGLI